jgi:hypothetical protein
MSLGNIQDAAYVGSWALVNQSIRSVCADFFEAAEGKAWRAAVEAAMARLRTVWGCTLQQLPAVDELLARVRPKMQHKATDVINGRVHGEEVAACQVGEERDMFLGGGDVSARAWVAAMAQRTDCAMSNCEFAAAMRLRLGCAANPRARCPHCHADTSGDRRGLHPFTCMRMQDMRTRRHTFLQSATRATLVRVPDLSATKSPDVARFWQSRPGRNASDAVVRADLCVTHVQRPGQAMLDFVVTHPSRRVHRTGAEGERAAAAAAEAEKIRHYEQRFDRAQVASDLVPMAFETSGAMGQRAMSFMLAMKDLAKRNDKPMSLFTMLVSMSVAVQRGNSMLLTAFYNAA